MGKRVHVAKKYVVEWSDTEAFNWRNEEFKSILNSLGCNVCEGEDGYSDEWEVETCKYKEALDFLKKNKKAIEDYDKDKNILKFPELDLEDIYDSIMSASYECGFDENYAYVLETMTAFYKERDKKCSYMHFSAW